MFNVGETVKFVVFTKDCQMLTLSGVVVEAFKGSFEGEDESGYHIKTADGETHYGVARGDVW
jgi:hypothetical protein